MATPEAPAASAQGGPNHGMRIFLIWLPLALIADLLIWFLLYPHLPPGDMSSSASHQQFDIAVMAVAAAPVLLFVWIYAGYALITWRHREGDDKDGPPIFSNTKIQATWIAATAVIVLGLFVFGTVELIVPAGAGAGEGPAPIWQPNTNNRLQVQVIGQQWAFTYRYPQFGGMESSELLLPDNTWVEFNVTSLDVIHSFWAYKLGVKADANPGVNNVAYTQPQQLGIFRVSATSCAACGTAPCTTTATCSPRRPSMPGHPPCSSRRPTTALLSALPAYATTYDPTVVPQLAASIVKIDGITGAAGYYYPPQDPVTP